MKSKADLKSLKRLATPAAELVRVLMQQVSVRSVSEVSRLQLRPHRLALVACWLALPCLITACGRAGVSGPGVKGVQPREAVTKIRFLDRADEAGIRFRYRDGQEAGFAAFLETLGGGVACFDYDGDQQLDLFLPGGGTFAADKSIQGMEAALYRQLEPWVFRNVAALSRSSAAPYYSHGAHAGDFNNDGFTDLLITNYGGLLLFRNQGDGTFIEIALESGLTDRSWSASAAWGDVDGDGGLDLYVTHYCNWSFANDPRCLGPNGEADELCGPRDFDGLPDTLYLSNLDGTFRDASRDHSLREDGKGLTVLMADLDVDGALDIYVGNDATPNFLYRNHAHATWEEIGLVSGTSLGELGEPNGSMGLDAGDYNGDGRFDLWAANFERESFALYENQGNWVFKHVSRPTGIMAVGQLYVGWGTAFFDADRDGDEDIIVANGHVIRYPSSATVKQAALLFENVNRQRFENVAAAASRALATPRLSRGLAVGDLDNDGDLDVTISHINEPVAVLENTANTEGGWLRLRLVGTTSNRDAVGSVVTVRAGETTLLRQIKGGGSFASSHDLRLHFGLGEIQQIDRLEIRWPSGVIQKLDRLRRNQAYTLVEPALVR